MGKLTVGSNPTLSADVVDLTTTWSRGGAASVPPNPGQWNRGDLVVFPDGGDRLAELIPAATLVTIEGMGHQSQDPARWQTIANAVISHAIRGRANKVTAPKRADRSTIARTTSEVAAPPVVDTGGRRHGGASAW